MQKLNDVIAGLIELHELEHPRVEYATINFPMRVLRYIENVATNLSHYDLVRKILKFKDNRSYKTQHGNLLL